MAAQSSLLDTKVSVQVLWSGRNRSFGLRLEHVLWGVLLIASLGARLVNLDVRAMSHDESLHALYSYYLYDRWDYVHDPMMHGPLLFHANALVYALLGVSDFTARLLPALAGTLVVGSMWWYRRYLGVWGALVAGLLLSISPSLLFHSRYIRNDIYIVLFTLLWVGSLLRYIESGKTKWMLGMSLGMLAGFISKENHFITGLIMGLFSCGMVVVFRLRPRILLRHAHRFIDVTVVMALLVLPFLAPLVHLVMGWDPLDTSRTGLTQSGVSAGVLGLIALSLGLLWFGRLRPHDWRTPFDVWSFGLTWLGFWVIACLFFSAFLTNPGGLVSGPVASLGYWLAQQEVQRGSQPWYYYLMLTSLYEYLPLLLALVGGGLGLRSLIAWFRHGKDAAPAGDTRLLDPSPVFVLFLIWWSIASWLAYTYAGERMPWLLTHMAAPMCLLGGYGTGRILDTCRERRLETAAIVAALAGGILLWIWASLLLPFSGRETEAVRATVQWIVALVAGAGLLGGSVWYLRTRRRPIRPALFLGILVSLALMTMRTSYLLTFVNYDYVTEYLTYAHGSPDVKQALATIDKIDQQFYGHKSIPVTYDDDNSWPMAWYFRDYPNAHIYRDVTDALFDEAVVLAGPARWDQVRPLLAEDYARRTYKLIWWPEESYKLWSRDTWDDWRHAAMRRKWQRIFFFRDYVHLDLSEWPHKREFDLYIRRDLAPLVWAETVDTLQSATSSMPLTEMLPRLDFPLQNAIAGEYALQPLSAPRSIRIADNGLRVLTDSGNHRVLVLDRENQLVLSAGSYCPLASDTLEPCVDPDGDGPLDLGDGQFNEPWGAVLSDEGHLYVSDTWNHRVQVLDLEGRFLMKWGRFGQQASLVPDEPVQFFGPRGVEVLPTGNILVMDTGNNRLLQFHSDGQLVDATGGRGSGLGHFNEPVDGWVNRKSGHLLVTDNWNRRIQLLTPGLTPIADFNVLPDMWNSEQAVHKPYLAAVPDFGTAVSDPENGRVVFFDVVGQPLGYIDHVTLQAETDLLPLGLAYDAQSAELLIVDGAGHKVHILDLSQATELLRQ